MPQLTAIILLAHLAFGCCWHQSARCASHGGDRELLSDTCPSHADHDAHGHHAQHDTANDHETPDSDRHHDHDSCADGQCSYVLTKSEISVQADSLVTPLYLAVATTAESTSNHSPLRRTEFAAIHGAAPPVRAHLLLGVLLI